MTEKTWLNKMETAEYIGVATRTIDRWRKEPQIYYHFPAPRYVAGRPRWNIKDLDAWIASQPKTAD